MNILAALKQEEKKLEGQLSKLQKQLNGVRIAAKALGDSASREVTQVKKRVLSSAAKAKISKAAKSLAFLSLLLRSSSIFTSYLSCRTERPCFFVFFTCVGLSFCETIRERTSQYKKSIPGFGDLDSPWLRRARTNLCPDW